jgi:hypothetical protein
VTTIHTETIGDKALIPRRELDRLLELARRSEPVEIIEEASEVPLEGIAVLAESGGAFRFLEDEAEHYSLNDLRKRYAFNL